jgi:hypothetical protein
MDFEVVPVFQDTSHFTIEIFKWTREHETGYEGNGNYLMLLIAFESVPVYSFGVKTF